MHTSSTAAVEFERVTKQYGDLRAVDAVSFAIAPGEMFGVIGPDGAGKTTAIRMMCGLLRPDDGRLRVLGRDPIAQHRLVTADIGYLSQRFSLYGDLSIDENIAFFAEIHGLRRYHDARNRLLDMTQLDAFRSRRADRLSGGMKQKLALACTLVHEPRILLLDEPTTGVDPVSRREFWKLLSEFLARGLTIVMSTPYLDEAERCGRVALLHDGRLLAVDRPQQLQSRLDDRLLEISVQAMRPPIEMLASLPGVADVQPFGDRAHVRVASGRASAFAPAMRQTLEDRGLKEVSVRPIAASLEDVFIDLIAGSTSAAPLPGTPRNP